MRFLANENFPGAAVKALVAAGHDVVWVRIAAPGTTDPDVLAWAAREERILLTFDKDFGELARDRRCRVPLVSSCCARRCQGLAMSAGPCQMRHRGDRALRGRHRGKCDQRPSAQRPAPCVEIVVHPFPVRSPWICRLSGGCCMPSRSAARVMCPSSATAMKLPEVRSSIVIAREYGFCSGDIIAPPC
jgi:hypothetical protein